MKEVNEARDKLKIAREERESWITDHNAAVSKEMKTGAEDEKVADSMVDHLIECRFAILWRYYVRRQGRSWHQKAF